MQKSARYRLIYFISMVATYLSGYQFLPDTLSTVADEVLTAVFAALYFIALPALYYYCVVVMGKQKLWKILISFSVSSLVARFTFPAEIATYFEFISWLRYPIMAVVIVLEIALVTMVVKSLWKARHLPGDPRLHAHKQFADDDKKRTAALLWAHEPASWFYAIPRFSRHHVPAIGRLVTRLAKPLNAALAILLTVFSTVLSYWLLVDWSQTAAVIVSSLVLWSVVAVVASIRLRRHFSVYVQGNDLVINAGIYRTLFADTAAISCVEAGCWKKSALSEALILGRGEQANVHIRLTKPAVLYSMMASIEEQFVDVYLVCEDPQSVVQHLTHSSALPLAS